MVNYIEGVFLFYYFFPLLGLPFLESGQQASNLWGDFFFPGYLHVSFGSFSNDFHHSPVFM